MTPTTREHIDAIFRREDFLFNVVFRLLRDMDQRYEPKKQPKPRASRAKKVGAAAVTATTQTLEVEAA
jgi:hypothetical protein